MLGQIPFASFSNTGQSTAQAVTTSAAVLVFTGATAGPSTSNREGDPAVKADPTNNRLIFNTPGIYKLRCEISGSAASALQTTLRAVKNGLTGTQVGRVTKKTWGTTPDIQVLSVDVEITAADLPAAGGIATFADPDATAGAGKPAGGFAGAGAAPLTGVPVSILVTGDGSVNFTMTDGTLEAMRIG